jgi:hypothetical protein
MVRITSGGVTAAATRFSAGTAGGVMAWRSWRGWRDEGQCGDGSKDSSMTAITAVLTGPWRHTTRISLRGVVCNGNRSR